MENTGFKFESRIFYFIDLQNEEDYERKKSSNTRRDVKQGVLSQFKTEADVSKFLKQLHAQVLEKMLEGEMDAHLGYEKNSVTGNNTGNSRNGSYPKKIQTEHRESVISVRINLQLNLVSIYTKF